MKIAIITLNYNGKENTIELLESLKKLDVSELETKVVVVDNASSDGSVSEIKKQFQSVDILQTGQNLGFGEGLNKGFEYAKIWGAGYFFVINNDSKIADPQVLQKLIKVLSKDPKIGVVTPKILFEKGFEFHKDKYSNSDLGKVIWYAGGHFDWDNIQSVHRGIDEVDQGQYDVEEEVSFISGACFLIKKEVLEKVKGFDGNYFLYYEDAEISKRIREAGFKLYYTGQASIYHKVSQSTGIGSALTDYYLTRNKLIFGLRFGKSRTKFALLREALKLLIFGREPQRVGVLDFLGLRSGVFTNLAPHIPGKNTNTKTEYSFKLSIGVVNYNTADLTKKLVESIFKKDSGYDPKTMEVIVLDNGNIDPCKEQINEFLHKVKYIKNQENEGFSKGYNKTIKYALGEYYLMFNSDIEVLKAGISELIKWVEPFKGEAVLGGKLVFPDGSSQDSVFHPPTLTGAFKEYFLKQAGAYFMYQPKAENPTQVEGMVMACLLIPRKILNKVGLLDEGTFIFFEDIEYARRLKQNNIPLYFVPTAKFIHHHGASTKRIGEQKAYEHLKKSAPYYHGKFYYFFLTLVLKFGQRLGRVKTPVSRWTKES